MAVEKLDPDKLESLARWVNSHPNDWNLWPYLLHSKTEASLVMDRTPSDWRSRRNFLHQLRRRSYELG